MTNREWLESLTASEMAEVLSLTCDHCGLGNADSCSFEGNCEEGVLKWLRDTHYEPKEFNSQELINAFQNKFQDRRAISLDEIKSTIRGLFE